MIRLRVYQKMNLKKNEKKLKKLLAEHMMLHLKKYIQHLSIARSCELKQFQKYWKKKILTLKNKPKQPIKNRLERQ